MKPLRGPLSPVPSWPGVVAINSDLEAPNALLEIQVEKMRRALYSQCPSSEHLAQIGA